MIGPGICDMSSPSTPIKDVGIIDMEIYFPSTCVDQRDLEKYDGVSPGKYTIGLGQEAMGFCNDLEDINSMCLTVLEKLMNKASTEYNIGYKDIGRLEVGTETIIDHAKSVKTVLMQLFEESGNTDVEGIDTMNACYGGTQALFNSVAWVESSSYEHGKYAIVVCGDIAVYSKGAARPTGGAGCVAMLIGPNAPLVVDSKTRASHFSHSYDFYKPELNSEYPTVDGKLSVECYLRALDTCYTRMMEKSQRQHSNSDPIINLSSFDYACFHSPYRKLVRKSYARLEFNDYLNYQEKLEQNVTNVNTRYAQVSEDLTNKRRDNTYFDRAVEKAFVELSHIGFLKQVSPTELLPKTLGNTYTASLYCGLISLLSAEGTSLIGKNTMMFSYGSGLASTMFLLNFKGDKHSPIYSRFNDLEATLKERHFVEAVEFDKVMKLRETSHHSAAYIPSSNINDLYKNTYYLAGIDDKHRRSYQRKN